MELECDVLVAGAGPTGLMMAAQLARRGVSFVLVDAGERHDGTCALTARAMEQLDRLGLAASIAKLARRSNQLGGVSVPFDHDDTRYPGIHVLPRRVLEDALLGYPGVARPTAHLRELEVDAAGLRARITAGVVRCQYAIICEPPCQPSNAPTIADLRDTLLTGRRIARRPRYRSGRVLFAGELGPNDGLQDAANLAWRLAAVVRGAPAALLDGYADERRPREVSRWLLRLAPIAMRPLARSRAALDVIARFASELDVAYRPSRYAREVAHGADASFHRAVRAGERLPDVLVGGARLHTMLRGPDPHVLVLGDCEPLDARVHVHHLRYAPATDAVFRALGVSTAAIYVVRPDLHVGFRSHGPRVDGLARYLDDISPPAQQAVTRSRSAAP